ncbi:hypothetical protein Patl1_31326 [Pistacia atlantica]|uniref:Uncharacterized protein n=1 Tax=Pistacia atlantica TaxID=434234 RepID=A0ACC1AE36_9ROSI|nr:hypothetical protein Patl1_31326 [Pistacia atlantica]
MITSSRWC